ncbi:hypothetical protein MLD38_014272 [Melastoma candidum]|uniref:Uncharacterized protein n=1 Tax=Melastoma candidum TaxID=119954 RepID=A0ACB9RFD3_9MYRT|nr:hypothetical protein MLD38_014272 [Melastoma candidum]
MFSPLVRRVLDLVRSVSANRVLPMKRSEHLSSAASTGVDLETLLLAGNQLLVLLGQGGFGSSEVRQVRRLVVGCFGVATVRLLLSPAAGGVKKVNCDRYCDYWGCRHWVAAKSLEYVVVALGRGSTPISNHLGTWQRKRFYGLGGGWLSRGAPVLGWGVMVVVTDRNFGDYTSHNTELWRRT